MNSYGDPQSARASGRCPGPVRRLPAPTDVRRRHAGGPSGGRPDRRPGHGAGRRPRPAGPRARGRRRRHRSGVRSARAGAPSASRVRCGAGRAAGRLASVSARGRRRPARGRGRARVRRRPAGPRSAGAVGGRGRRSPARRARSVPAAPVARAARRPGSGRRRSGKGGPAAPAGQAAPADQLARRRVRGRHHARRRAAWSAAPILRRRASCRAELDAAAGRPRSTPPTARRSSPSSASENRTIVPIDEIPEYVQNAVIAGRGQELLRPRRHRHEGHRPRRVEQLHRRRHPGRLDDHPAVRAARRRAEGRSATTASSARRSSPASWSDKYSKDEILGCYLNSVYFGRGAYGIEAAAQAYFGKSVDQPARRARSPARRRSSPR